MIEIRKFDYVSKGEKRSRTVLVLHENEKAVGGLDLGYLTEEQIADAKVRLANHVIGDFVVGKRGAEKLDANGKPYDKADWMKSYRRFNKTEDYVNTVVNVPVKIESGADDASSESYESYESYEIYEGKPKPTVPTQPGSTTPEEIYEAKPTKPAIPIVPSDPGKPGETYEDSYDTYEKRKK